MQIRMKMHKWQKHADKNYQDPANGPSRIRVAEWQYTVTHAETMQGPIDWDGTYSDEEELVIPKGIKHVTFSLEVHVKTSCPQYQNWLDNDGWTAQLTINGKSLYSISRTNDGARSSEPRLMRICGDLNPETENLYTQVVFDVSAYTKNGPATVVVRATASESGECHDGSDFGWRCLTTGLWSSVGYSPEQANISVRPESKTPDDVFSVPVNPPPYADAPPKNGKNVFDRAVIVEFDGPDVDKDYAQEVKAALVYFEYDRVPERETWSGLSEPIWTYLGKNRVEMVISASDKGKTFPYAIADSDFGRYVTVRALFWVGDSGNPMSTNRLTFRNLYRAPPWNSTKRTGTRDKGGDDWSSASTYRWLKNNKSGARPVKFNDVSGEHGRDLGHKSHDYGQDVDTLQFGEYSGTPSGCANYLSLRSDVLTATTSTDPDTIAQASARVTAWIDGQRSGLEFHQSDTEVEGILVGAGEPVEDAKCSAAASPLESDWLKRLIVSGKISRPRELNIGGGMQDTHKISFRRDHNDHNHIDVVDR